MKWRFLPLLAPLLLPFAPAPAHACGGTFCDNLPDPMPVDQRGEDILFVLDGVTVEVHIRIEYTGEAERFAWVVPLQAIPEVSVGSEPLFTALSNATAPVWQTVTEYDCPDDDPYGETGLTTMGFVPSSDFNAASEPDIVFQETVGAFDVVVLQGGTAAEVINFLDANNYAQDPAAEPILQEYLDGGFLFAAVKLTSGVDVQSIHPLVFRFPGNEPCVPIRLTRIAAEDDMGIRTYFLGQERWVPSNYLHVELNPLAFDWQHASPETYLELLSLAVDEAGGRAFATEYAGTSEVVETGDVYSPSWDETAFIGADPILALQLIAEQGLNRHPLIISLLLEFIPPPDGLTPQEFYNNLSYYADQIDLSAWDDVAFAAALAERIIDPGMHASDLIEAWPKLTRLDTTMSPDEMMVDPTFHTNDTLPDVDRAHVTTIAQAPCGSGDRIYHVLLDGEDMPVCVPEYQNYPTPGEVPKWVDMPWMLRSEQIPMVGAPQIVEDKRDAILYVHELYQDGATCSANGGDGDGDSGGGGSESGGSNDSYSTTDGIPANDPYGSSCACSAQRSTTPITVVLGMLVLGLIGPWRRRD